MGGKKITVSDERISEAIRQCHGLISYAAKKLGINRTTVYRRIKKSAILKESVEDSDEMSLDHAEFKLLSKIDEGDLGAICFYLKCKGKKRGYVEKEKIEQNVLLAQLPGFEVKLVEPKKGLKKDAGDA